jgi:CheY-like chemotaxis protein
VPADCAIVSAQIVPAAAAGRLSAPGAPRRALIVDDDATTRALLTRILRVELGCEVAEAAHGAEAMGLLQRQRFDLMVLDVLMPVMDGIGTLERVRRVPALLALPVIVLSAVRDEARVRRLVQLGIAGYLVKPLRPAEVVDRLKRLVPTLEAAWDASMAATSTAALVPVMRPFVVSATSQVFGMMLGLEVLPDDAPASIGPEDDRVDIRLHLERGSLDLLFSLTAPRSVTEQLTSASLHGRPVVGDQAVADALRDLAAVVGSRLQSALRHRGDVVTLGSVTMTRGAGDFADDPDEARLTLTFSTRAQNLRFTTVLRAVPARRPEPPPGLHPEPVARTLTMDMSLLPPPVDTEVLEMLASLQEPGEPDLLVELVSLFLRDTPERLQELVVRPLAGSPVARVAHAVKGSAGNLGAMHLQELASELEQAGHQSRSSDELAALADAVCAEYARVELYLQGVLTTRTGDAPTTH